MTIRKEIATYLYENGLYHQAFDYNNKLLENFENDYKYNFYLAFNRIGDLSPYGNSKVVILPFIIHLKKTVTLHCIHPYI